MKLKYAATGLLLLGIVLLLHFIPISHAEGLIEKRNIAEATTCEAVESSYSFRLISSGRKEYEAVRKTFVKPVANKPCGYEMVKAKLFVL